MSIHVGGPGFFNALPTAQRPGRGSSPAHERLRYGHPRATVRCRRPVHDLHGTGVPQPLDHAHPRSRSRPVPVGWRWADAVRCGWRHDHTNPPPQGSRRSALRVAIGRQVPGGVDRGASGNPGRGHHAGPVVLLSPLGSRDHGKNSRGGRCTPSPTHTRLRPR